MSAITSYYMVLLSVYIVLFFVIKSYSLA